jgi:hypothetical protein
MINDNIIEQVTFEITGVPYIRIQKFFRRLIANLQQNKGAIQTHFGKQMNKETKLRIHNIIAKAALKFGSEVRVLKKREEQSLEAAQIKFFETVIWNNKTR